MPSIAIASGIGEVVRKVLRPRAETTGGVAPRVDPRVQDRPPENLSPRHDRDEPRDRRYGTSRWQKVRLLVLRRDGWACQVARGCPERATVADHIVPVFPGMPDALFFDPANLRASCKRHNTARGVAARLEREAGPERESSVVTGDYS